MPVEKLKELLDNQNIKYITISHPTAYCAQEIASSAHIPGKELAKTVMVKIDGKMAMVMVPACCKVDFDLLKKFAGAITVELAAEKEFKDLFPGCDVGAMPPFGNLYGLNVFMAEGLAENKEIAFNGGSHSELIKLSYQDFKRLVTPKVGEFTSK